MGGGWLCSFDVLKNQVLKGFHWGSDASGEQQFKLSPFVFVWFPWRFRTGHSYLVTDNSLTEHV